MRYLKIHLRKWFYFFLFWIWGGIQVLIISNLRYDPSSIVPFTWKVPFTFAWLPIFLYLIIVVVLQFLLLFGYAMYMIRNNNLFVELYPQVESVTYLGGLSSTVTPDFIQGAIQQLANKAGVKVSRAIVAKNKVPNAFTFSVPIMGSFLVFHSNLIEICDQTETEAVIAHELAHIKNRDGLIQIIGGAPKISLHVIYVYIYALFGLSIATPLLLNFDLITAGVRSLFLLMTFAIVSFLNNVATIILNRSSKEAEMLADLFASSLTSPEAVINLLVKLGTRVEVIHSLRRELLWLINIEDPKADQLDGATLGRLILELPNNVSPYDGELELLAPYLFVASKLHDLQKYYQVELSDIQISQLAINAAHNLHEQRKRQVKEGQEQKSIIVDWRMSDVDQSGHLDISEIRMLVKDLRKPDRTLFKNSESVSDLSLDHPNIRARILSISRHFLDSQP